MGLFSTSDLEYMFWNGIRNGSIGTIGAKGDPGGITTGTLLGTVDLNTITADGVYRQSSGANATLINNYPATTGGILLVLQMNGTGYLTQIYYPLDVGGVSGRRFYRREFVTPTWSPWRVYSSTRTDQTAGRAIYQWDDLNNREQLIYGDTGTRNVVADLVNGWTATTFHIARRGTTVTLSHYVIDPTARTDVKAYIIPSGFRPYAPSGNLMFPQQMSNASVLFTYYDPATSALMPPTSLLTANNAIQQWTWETNDAWPTSLPGTAIGTIPNL